MQYKLLKAQREFLEIPHDYSLDVAVYQGGYGSGKTFAGSLLGILLCLKFPGIRGLVGAQTYTLVRDTTLQTYREHLDNIGFVEGTDYEWSASLQKLTFKNSSEILFKHFDEPDKLKSLNLGFAEIEEMSDIPYDTFKMLLGRMRQRVKKVWKNFTYRIFGHTNPEMHRGWVYRTFVENTAVNYRLITAPTTQNIYLPEGFCEELKKIYDEQYYKIFVLAQNAEYNNGLVIKDFTDENVKDITYCPEMDLHISCDFNVDPMCWVLAHKTEGKVFYFDEIAMENTTTSKACDEFCSRYPNHKGRIIINGDASGDNRSCTSEYTNYVIIKKKLLLYGYETEIRIKAFNPPIKNRIMAFNAKVRSADGEVCLYVDKKCEKLLYNIYNLKYREGSSKIDIPSYRQIKQSGELKFLSHPIDAASYLVDFYWPITL
ncbi:MAG: phage terminase large subunit [Heliobacteriaceae bacterium]|jgi:PBSX family phage terminase large subunit|nr:phage terminase large subunit [Heliobacteriaceae bacterium]